jgi:mannose-6-phosphate isomerase-like protein (cupin superfamily)
MFKPTIDEADHWVRPWGEWWVLYREPGLKIKKLVIKPGKEVSTQFHNHRAEYWTVLAGIGRGILDLNHTYYLDPGDSLYVEKKRVHKIINDGTVDLVIIELQTGEILKETDIERIEIVETIERPNQSVG